MIGSAESPLTWDVSPATMAHLGSQPVCSRVVHERLDHVADGMGLEEGLELDLAAVDVPIGEVGVLLDVRGQMCTLPSLPGVLAVHVGHDVGEEERVVERGVEGVLLGRRAPVRRDATEQRRSIASWARAATWRSDQPGSSAARFCSASRVLTKEMPTFMRTSCCDVVSKVTNAPHDVPVQAGVPGGRCRTLVQVPADENGRSKRAKKYSV